MLDNTVEIEISFMGLANTLYLIRGPSYLVRIKSQEYPVDLLKKFGITRPLTVLASLVESGNFVHHSYTGNIFPRAGLNPGSHIWVFKFGEVEPRESPVDP